jgi:iron complex outermembrane receptor protein
MPMVTLQIRSSVQACAIAIALMGTTVPAFAQPIDLPSQALSRTLSQLSSEANVNIIAQDSLVAGKQAPAVSGDLSVRDALTRVLQGTGLKIEQRDEKTYLIVAPSQSSTATKTDATLPTITVVDSAISAGNDNGFVSDRSSTALRTDTPISETPQSIQVINSDQLQSHQTQSVVEALSMAGGVTVQDTGKGNPAIFVRGFQARTMTNGSDDTGYGNALSMPIAGIQQIEILKGADSILSGAMTPGGIVNVTTKQPTATPTHEATLQAGSYGDWLGSIDLGGALTQDDRLTYRFILSGEHAGETFGGYNGQKDLYVAPSIGWKSGDTSVVLGYQHHVQNEPLIPMTLIDENGPVRVEGRPTPQANTLMQSDVLSFDFKQKFGGIFEFEDRSQYQDFDLKFNNTYIPSGPFGPGLAFYSGSAGNQHSYGIDTDNHVRATFSIGPVKQTVLAGFDFDEFWGSQEQGMAFAIAPFPIASLPAVPSPYRFIDNGKSYADNAYLQDQLSWGRLHVLASVSYGSSWASQTALQSAWSPNFGVLYQLTDSVAAYANLFRSFTPQNGVFLAGGVAAPPQTGRTAEAGFKFSFLDDRLTMTADVYRSALLNITQLVPGTDFNILTGGQVTRGFEWSATGHVLPGLNIVANYTYAEELQASSQTSIVPRHVGNIWATYDLQGEKLHGWGLGVGIQPRTHYKIYGTDETIPGQVQTDASVYYKAKKWSAIFGVKNIFNNTLYDNYTFGSGSLGLETGRVLYLTGTYDF